MAGTKPTAKMTGLSEFIKAWKAFQQTPSKLNGLQLLFVINNIEKRIIQSRVGSSSNGGMIEADTLLPTYETLLRRAKLPSDSFGEQHIARFDTLVTNATDSRLEIASSALHVSSILNFFTSKEEAETEPGELSEEQQAALFRDVFETHVKPFSIDEHVETHVLPELEALSEKMSKAKQCLAKIIQDKPEVSPEQLVSFGTLMEIDPQYSPESRELIKGVLGTFHTTGQFKAGELSSLLTPPSASAKDPTPRQRIFNELLKKASDAGLTAENARLITSQFDFFNQINEQSYLLKYSSSAQRVQELKIVLRLYIEAIQEDDEELRKTFTAIESGRKKLISQLLAHFQKIRGTKMDEPQLRILLTNTQAATSFPDLLEKLKTKGILPKDFQQDPSDPDIIYAELLFNLQKGSFDVCQEFNTAAQSPDEESWTKFKNSAVTVHNIIVDNKELLGKKIDFLPILERAYLTLLRFFGFTEKRNEYVAEQYKTKMLPVLRLSSHQKLDQIVAKMTQKQQAENTNDKPSVDSGIKNTVNEISTSGDTAMSTVASEKSNRMERRKRILHRTTTLTCFDDDLLAELAGTYQEEKEKAVTGEVQQSGKSRFSLLATGQRQPDNIMGDATTQPSASAEPATYSP